MAKKKYNLDRLFAERETAEMTAVDAVKQEKEEMFANRKTGTGTAFNAAGRTKEEMAETADLFRERGTEYDDGRIDRLLGIEHKNEKVITVSIKDIRPFGGEYGKHRFRTNEDKVSELAESIGQVGILNPLIVRKDPQGIAAYEVIAGMTRRLAAIKAGLDSVPVIVRECDDLEAELIMVASNHQREDLLPSEKGWMYRIEYEAMKRKAGRKSDEEINCGQDDHNLSGARSIDELAEKSEDSRKQIQRFIRLTYLADGLLTYVDNKKIPLVAAVDLSYLSDDEQECVNSVIFGDNIKITAEMAATLKETSQNDHKLTVTDVHNICKESKR